MRLQTGTVTRVHPTLPIFRLDLEGTATFYTPGQSLPLGGAAAADVETALASPSDGDESAAAVLARQLETAGRAARASWDHGATKPFEPECLTVYLSNRCNLGCSYCFAAPAEPAAASTRLRLIRGDEADARFSVVSEAAVAAAARVVAAHCARSGKPLTLVVHGGGEPTLHWDLLQRVRAMVSAVADAFGISSWAYIATHGALPEDRVRWLAASFDLIGLSCDGPPEIQNQQRPLAAGGATAALVERTAAVLRECGTPFTVRATITPATVAAQRRIVEYACKVLQTRSIRFEPAYDARRAAGPHFVPGDAEGFVEAFLEASADAAALDCDLQVSGVRPGDIHGPYCNPLREVLHVTPDGVGTACFLSTGAGGPEEAQMALGHFDVGRAEFIVDAARAAELRRRAARVPARCEKCMNVYHCARDCPDVCVITADSADEVTEGFRCRVQKLLAFHWTTAN